ncbi:MAG: metallophosphoesterase [Planctomycetes bacterium]|nr:metallophosphoesterase [Planctomycetota bacterium]
MIRRTLVLVLLSTAAAGCRPVAQWPDHVIMGPHTSSVSMTEATVVWVTPPGAQTTAGLSPNQGFESAAIKAVLADSPISDRPERVHTLKLSRLIPGATYRYFVTCDGQTVEGLFRTAPPRCAKTPVRFVAYGDTRTYPERHRRVIDAMARQLPIDFVLHTGDLVENGDVWTNWPRDYFGPARAMLALSTWWTVRGNHEGQGPLYRDLLALPDNELYYSFDFGNVHCAMLDSYVNADRLPEGRADPEMVRWLEHDLASTKADWIVVAYHEPTFNIGGHGSTWGQSDVLPILEKYGVDIVVTGHSHLYERFKPIGPRGGKPIIHIVSGGGGAPTYPTRPSPILAQAHSTIHFCLFEVCGNHLEMTVFDDSDRVIDRLSLEKSATRSVGVTVDESADPASGLASIGRLDVVRSPGRYQDSVMEKMIETSEAIDMAFLESPRLSVEYRRVPEAQRDMTVHVTMQDRLPPDAVVRFTTAAESGWTVEPAEFWVADEPFALKVQPPANLKVGKGRIQPSLRLGVAVTYRGKTYGPEDRTPSLAPATTRLLTPEPVASLVRRAATDIVVDGRLDEWAAVAPLTIPSKGAAGTIAKMAWGPDGLYIAMNVRDSTIKSDPGRVWQADGMELFIEGDYARSDDAQKNPAATKMSLYPQPDKGPGAGGIDMSYGRFKDSPQVIAAAWQPVSGGYTMEILIPTRVLRSAAMAAGTKIGFHYVLYDDGRAIESFADTRGKSGVWRTGLHWGAVQLVN